MKRLIQSWENFWWSDIEGFRLKWVRICFGVSVFCFYSVRFWNLNFYDERSLVSRDQALKLFELPSVPAFSWNFWPDSWALLMQILFLVLMALFTIGKTRRPLMWLTWIIHVGFLQRNWSASMGVDTMVTVFLFYLSFCEVWKEKDYDLLTKTMVRMSSIHLCIIYFYTGVEKFRGGSWWEGSSLWTVLNNPQMAIFNFEWTVHFPWVLAAFAHLTVLFELFFGVLVWNPRTRLLILTTGFLFHVGIGISLDLWAFSAVMLSQYLFFMNKSDFVFFRKRFASH